MLLEGLREGVAPASRRSWRGRTRSPPRCPGSSAASIDDSVGVAIGPGRQAAVAVRVVALELRRQRHVGQRRRPPGPSRTCTSATRRSRACSSCDGVVGVDDASGRPAGAGGRSCRRGGSGRRRRSAASPRRGSPPSRRARRASGPRRTSGSASAGTVIRSPIASWNPSSISRTSSSAVVSGRTRYVAGQR